MLASKPETATLEAEDPRAVREHGKQATAARACADYAALAPSEAVRARYLERAARYTALALHLCRVTTGDPLGRICPTVSLPTSAQERLNAALDLSDPTRDPDRHRLLEPDSAHVRARTLLAAPGAPNRALAAAAA